MGKSYGGVSTGAAMRTRLDPGPVDLWERHMARAADEAALDTAWLPTSRRGPPVPTAVVLHGGRGLFGDGDALLPARSLVASGLNVLLVRGLGERAVDLDGCLSCEDLGRPVARVRGLLDQLADLAGDGRPPSFGIVGISASGPIALEVGAVDPRVRGVASCFAPHYTSVAGSIANAPPILILHGRADAAVPVGRAWELETFLRARGSEVERVEYEDEGHGFTGPAQLDAVRRISDFLCS